MTVARYREPDFAWRLYLAGGGTFSDTDGPPEASPTTPRVVAVAQVSDESPSVVLVNGSVYIYHADRGIWLDHDWVGALAEARERVHLVSAWREGAYVTKTEFAALWHQARVDLGLEPGP